MSINDNELKSNKNFSDITKGYKPLYECDLHCHTTRSDGNDTPKELIERASNLGMKAIAITDHDIDPPLYILDESGRKTDIKKFAKNLGLDLILGYEFSCDTYVDDVHIIGYELDWKSRLVKEEVERAEKSKLSAYKQLCEVLTEHGMPIDYEKEILVYSDEDGKVRTRTPEEVERKHIFEVMAKKGYAKSWSEAKLKIRDNPALNVRREKISPLAAIELIKKCGGLAVLAHPYLIDEEVNSKELGSVFRDEYIDKLIEAGLDGIESCYTYNKTTYKGSMSNDEIQKEVENKYGGKVKFFTGGSDFHNDVKKGVKNSRMIGEAGISYHKFKRIFHSYL